MYGNLLLQKDPGATTLYLPGEQISLDTATQALSGVRYYPLPGGGLAYRTGAGSAYGFEITDQHGTAGLELDSTGQDPTWRQFTPYGAPRGTAAAWADNRGFLDKPTDQATGLTIIGARQYDPATGRFISLDPVLEAASSQQLNGYTYAAGNPITQSDPSGLMVCGEGVCGSPQAILKHTANVKRNTEIAARNQAVNQAIDLCRSGMCLLNVVHNFQRPAYAAQRAQQYLATQAIIAARERAQQEQAHQVYLHKLAQQRAQAQQHAGFWGGVSSVFSSAAHWVTHTAVPWVVKNRWKIAGWAEVGLGVVSMVTPLGWVADAAFAVGMGLSAVTAAHSCARGGGRLRF